MRTFLNCFMPISSIVLLGAVAISCKPAKTKARLANIDAVIQNNQALRSSIPCGLPKGTITSSESDLPKTPAAALDTIYRVMPPRFKDYFDFKKDANVVKLVAKDGLKSACRGPLSTNPEFTSAGDMDQVIENLSACWTYEGKTPNKRPVIYIQDDVKAINGSLLAIMSLAFAQGIVDNALLKMETGPVYSFAAEFSKKRELLAARAITDLTNANYPIAAAYQEKYKSVGGPAASADFGNFIFSEFVDSYYCSGQTYATFETKAFSQSKAFMQDFTDFLGKPYHL